MCCEHQHNAGKSDVTARSGPQSVMTYLRQKDAQQPHGETPKLVLLDQLIQIETEQLKDQTQVVLEDEEVVHSHNVVLIIRVAQPVEVLQHPHFHSGLVIESCLVLDNLDCYHIACVLANAFRHLPKGALSQHFADNVPGKQCAIDW